MPELPEVEVLRRSLEGRCRGRSISEVEVFDRRLREPIDAAFATSLEGRMIERLGRRAKYLLAHLNDHQTLMVHLGMSGRLIWQAGQREPQKHEHWRIRLDDGSTMRYQDPRRFGLARVVNSGHLNDDRKLRHLGVEPLSDDFSGRLLQRSAVGRRRAMKEFLMDQTVVVGVGNIYASEALHRARVHPRRQVSRVAAATWTRVAESVQWTLRRAIEAGGSTLNDFRNGVGESGYFQIEHAVYDRHGQPCHRCSSTIRRIVLGGRSSYYCPGCQH